MNTYSAYGLTIQSEFDLPELPPIKEGTPSPDVVVHEDVISAAEAESVEEADPDVGLLKYDSIGTFLIEDGERIRCHPVSEDTPETTSFRRTLENQAMAVLLLQRGLVILHASAVSVDGGAVIFLGERTAGKSTTAAAFDQAGYKVLSDDIVGITFREGMPMVVPSVPQLRLSPDAVEALGIERTTQPTADHGPEKWYKHLNYEPEPATLRGCYVLKEGEEFEIQDVSPPEQLKKLINQGYPRGLISGDGMTSTDLDQYATVTETADVKILERPKEYDALPSLVERVVSDQ